VTRHSHHLLKTFWGWRDKQLPDATVIWTMPDGHSYITTPGSARGLCETVALWPLRSHKRGPWVEPVQRIVGKPFVLRAVGRHGNADEEAGLFQREIGVLHQPHRQNA
jgi:hypothetical protein